MARMEQIPRQWRIIRRLEVNRFGMTASDLADEEECPIRTIYRDLQDLEEAGFPLIQVKHGKRSLWKLAFNRESAQVPFQYTEVCSLWLGHNMMELWKGSVFYDSMLSAFEKIRATLPPGPLEHFEDFSDKVVVRGFQALPQHASEFVKQIHEAMESQETLEMTYDAPDKGESVRKIDPYRLWIQDNVQYLMAYCHLRKAIRQFHLLRIRTLKATGEFFEEDPNFEAEKYLMRSFRKMGGEETHEIEILFDSSVRHIFQERVFHDTQELIEQKDGSVLMRFKAGGLQEIRSWVLGFGPQAEVLKPEILRDDVKAALKAASKRYK